MAAADPERTVDLDRKRRSDEDLLRTIGRDLAALYSDVLHAPIPEGIAEVASRLAALSQACSAPLGTEVTGRRFSADAQGELQR
ncbi:MAG: hypothetical protein K0R61_2999 [Microvirga sp.]|jgi:hypothetical protein|nr:hypothetical protein [Microvirga sp.]